MMPCSSGNSPTMSVSRSALASSAACVGLRWPARRRPAARRSPWPARARARRARPACPACCDRPPWPGRATREASVFLRSWSKKNLASARRGRTTRSLPPITALASCGPDVADHQELVGQLALRVEQREVLLVGLHREDQAFLRHFEELLLELADQHIGALDQRGDFVEQRFVLDRRGAAADLARPRRRAGARSRRGGPRSWRSRRRLSPAWRRSCRRLARCTGSAGGLEAVAAAWCCRPSGPAPAPAPPRCHAAPPAHGPGRTNFTSLQPSASW